MISYKEAREMIDKRYTKVTRYKDAWWFVPEGSENMYGGDQGWVVMKKDGKILRLYEYALGSNVIDKRNDDNSNGE